MSKITYKLAGFTGAVALLLTGCFVPVGAPQRDITRKSAPPLSKPGADRVTVESRSVYSSEETPPLASLIIDSARRSIGQSSEALDKLVQRWPDVSIDLLRKSIGSAADMPIRLLVASAYDRVFDTAIPSDGWSNALTVASSQSSLYAPFAAQREQILALFHNGRFTDAARIDLSSKLPADAPAALRAEALRVTGLALLLNNQPDRAAEILSGAATQAQTGPHHALFELALLVTEADRRANRALPAAQAWTSAVTNAGRIHDPELWERAILAKPDGVTWPRLANGDEPLLAGIAPDTGTILISVGKMRLSRNALQPALLAFSRAEAETSSATVKSLAILYRAQTMIALQQAASALPMLESLAGSDDPRMATRAAAVKGDIFCRVLNDRQHGIPMIREALLQPTAVDWPEKNQLIANLGLYYILDGRDEEGLVLLHQAQANFEASGQLEDLAEALKNEAASLQATGKLTDAKAVQDRADDICRSAGLPVGPLIVQNASATPR